MYQHAGIGHIISVVILNLEVVDLDWAFQQFMLDLFDNHILAVDENQDVTGTEMYCIRPTLYWGIERMGRRCNNFLAAYKDMHQLVCFIDISLHDLLQRNILRVFIPGPDVIAYLYGLYGCRA